MKPENRYYKIIFFAVGAVISLTLYILLELSLLGDWGDYNQYKHIANRFIVSLFLIFSILLIGKFIEKLIDNQGEIGGYRYNLIRITRLIATILALSVALSFIFKNVYATLTGLGFASIVLGFALQAPITSFIAWIYIIFRKPYQVGDRIQLNGMRGDVVEVHYLETLIEECSGDYMKNDHPSGRVIRFPNSVVLKTEVINYNGGLTPFIWNETALQVAYTSDLDFVEECLMKAVKEDFQESYPFQATRYDKKWTPQVYFRNNAYAWMEAVVSYTVKPTDTTGRRNRILRKALKYLNESPDKVQFPTGVQR